MVVNMTYLLCPFFVILLFYMDAGTKGPVLGLERIMEMLGDSSTSVAKSAQSQRALHNDWYLYLSWKYGYNA